MSVWLLPVFAFMLQLPAQQQTLSNPREISGQVYDARTGQPIEAAAIEVQIRSIVPLPLNTLAHPGFHARSDSGGHFEISVDIAGSRALFTVKKRGYIPAIEEVEFPPAEPRLAKQFALLPGGSLGGSVRDAVTQEPIIGASVKVFMDTPPLPVPHAQPGTAGYANATDGSYEIEGLSEGVGTAFAQSPGYAFAYRRISIRAGEVTTGDFELQKSGTVSGVVVDTSGRPMPNREVLAVQLDTEVVSLIRQAAPGVARTNSGGEFTIDTNIVPGKAFALEVNPAEQDPSRGPAPTRETDLLPALTETMAISQPGGSISGVRLVLEKGAGVTIRVTDSNGSPLAGARVHLRKRLPNNASELPRTVVREARRVGVSTNAAGIALFQGVSAGEWHLMVGRPGYRTQRTMVQVAQESVTFDVQLSVFGPPQ